MFRSRSIRLAVASAAIALPLVGAATVSGAPAWAKFVGIKCTTLTGNVSSTVTLSGCNGNTGGSSVALPVSTLAGGGVVTWVNSQTTTFGTPTISSTEADGSHDALKGSCSTSTTEEEVKGTVTADTTGSAPVGGSYKLEVCVNGTTGAINNEPGSKIKIG